MCVPNSNAAGRTDFTARRILSACVAEQERSEILSRLEACLNSQAGSPDLRQRGDYLRHLSYLRNEQFCFFVFLFFVFWFLDSEIAKRGGGRRKRVDNKFWLPTTSSSCSTRRPNSCPTCLRACLAHSLDLGRARTQVPSRPVPSRS